MHLALRKGPLFLQKTPPFSTFFTNPFAIFYNPIFHFLRKHPPPISFPAYGPVVVYKLSWSVVVVLPISSVCILALLVHA